LDRKIVPSTKYSETRSLQDSKDFLLFSTWNSILAITTVSCFWAFSASSKLAAWILQLDSLRYS
ncbi:hypothetical protein, partial [Vibrio vulnificus]|uniref:hypothetical protein n=1 Tax=Vibrio vulnificus TaxID=672 RepID=UPI0019D43CCB